MPAKGQTTDIMKRLENKSYILGECKIWTGKIVQSAHGSSKFCQGYGSIWYEGKNVRIGRLICHLFHNADLNDNSWTANHKSECISSLCWNPEHLYPGTQADNVADSIKDGTFHYGTDNLNGGDNFDKEKYMEMRHGKSK